MRFWEKLFEGRKKKEKEGLSPEMIKQVLDIFGLTMLESGHLGFKTDANKSILSDIFPIDYSDFANDFMKFWTRQGFSNESDGEIGRQNRYRHYDFMKSDSPEIALFRDTIISEALSYRIGQMLCQFTVKDRETGKIDKELTKFVNKRIQELSFNEKVILEGLVDYGNFWFLLDIKDKVRIKMPIIDPKMMFIKVRLNSIIGYALKMAGSEKEFQIYEVQNFSLDNTEKRFFPYGRSMLESCRSPYKKLMILESLLALSRSSKVDKLVIKFPTGETNAVDMLNKAVRIRSMLKNLVYGTGTDIKSANKPLAFTDILLAPQGTGGEGFFFDRLPSGIDLTSIEDIQYFWNKFISGTRMSRALFVPDETYQGYRKLSLQDLRFARSVLYLIYSYSVSLLPLAKIILSLEKNIPHTKVFVEVEHINVTPIAAEQMDAMLRGVDAINQVVSTLQTLGIPSLSLDLARELFAKFTLIPADLLDRIFKSAKKQKKLMTDVPPEEGEGEFPEEPMTPYEFEEALTLEELKNLQDKIQRNPLFQQTTTVFEQDSPLLGQILEQFEKGNQGVQDGGNNRDNEKSKNII